MHNEGHEHIFFVQLHHNLIQRLARHGETELKHLERLRHLLDRCEAHPAIVEVQQEVSGLHQVLRDVQHPLLKQAQDWLEELGHECQLQRVCMHGRQVLR